MPEDGSLIDIANKLVSPRKGILATDESTGTIGRRFDSVNVENTEQNRRDYREMLFRTEGISEYISGVILYDETIRQMGADGAPLAELLQEQGLVPGIKMDKGTHPLPAAPGEVVTEGLDGLRERLVTTTGWEQGSPSGARSSASARTPPAGCPWRQTPTRWDVSRP